MSELDSFPGHLIRRLHQRSVAIYSSYANELDVTQVQFAALCSLDATPGIDQVNLATSIALDKVTTGEVVTRLVKKGLVRREVRTSDRRSFELNLTSDGEAILKRLRSLTRSAQKDLLSPLTAAEQKTLLELVSKLVFDARE